MSTHMIDSRQLLQDYERDGVVLIHQFLSAEQVAEVRREIDRYIREDLTAKPADARTMEADGKTVRNLWRLEQHNPGLRAARTRQRDDSPLQHHPPFRAEPDRPFAARLPAGLSRQPHADGPEAQGRLQRGRHRHSSCMKLIRTAESPMDSAAEKHQPQEPP